MQDRSVMKEWKSLPNYSLLPGIGSLTRSGLQDPVHEPTEEELAEQRGQWLSQLFSENPQLVSLRERLLPWTGGRSFANVVHSDPATVLAHVSRHTVLELVVQHLRAIGMHLTARAIERESGHPFQVLEQPWDKTDLSLVVSLGVLPLEDPWAMTDDSNHHYVEEFIDEDFFASPYREDPMLLYQELLDLDLHVVYAEDKPRSLGTMRIASLRRLVVFLATSNPLDEDIHRFFLVLHTATSSRHFFEHLVTLFNCHVMSQDDPETHAKLLAIQDSLQPAVINLLKKWTYFQGLFIGRKALKACGDFLRGILETPFLCEKFEKFAWAILDLIPKLTSGMKQGQLSDPREQPDIPDAQILFRPTLKMIDPSSLEVARQITLIFHAAFRAVHSREFMVALGSEGELYQTPTLAEFFSFGERLTRLSLETLLAAPDKNQAAAQLLEIANQLEVLCNFDALSSILGALRRTELGLLPFLQQATVRDNLRRLVARCGDDPASVESYKDAIRRQYDSWNSTIPNVKVELRDSMADRSPSFINNMINWEKRWKNSAETSMLYRFQNKPYNFWPVPQIQTVINRGPSLTEEQIHARLNDFVRSAK
jgi:hypothetical protein